MKNASAKMTGRNVTKRGAAKAQTKPKAKVAAKVKAKAKNDVKAKAKNDARNGGKLTRRERTEKRQREEEEAFWAAKEAEAASKIQNFFLHRKAWHEAEQKRQQEEESRQEFEAAQRMKSIFQGKQEREKAAKDIQAAMRTFIARNHMFAKAKHRKALLKHKHTLDLKSEWSEEERRRWRKGKQEKFQWVTDIGPLPVIKLNDEVFWVAQPAWCEEEDDGNQQDSGDEGEIQRPGDMARKSHLKWGKQESIKEQSASLFRHSTSDESDGKPGLRRRASQSLNDE